MLGDLQKQGFKYVRKPRDADVVIVNTCAFIDTARGELALSPSILPRYF
jgi:tRNA A37 methylthiotransferase MiaB